MGRVPIPLARSWSEMESMYGKGYQPFARPPWSNPPRSYQPTQPSKEQNPPQSVSGIIPYAERVMAPQSFDPNRSTYVPPDYWDDPFEVDKRLLAVSIISLDEFRAKWGFTTREVANALLSPFRTTPDPIGDSNDGIAPCGYEEL